MVKKKLSRHIIAALFILPAFLLYTALLISPIIQTVYQSFFSWDGIAQNPLIFVGFENYQELFKSKEFWVALGNVGKFILVGFFIQMPFAFLLGLFVTSKIKFISFFKTAFFIPVVLPMTAVGIMWTFILWPTGGLLNNVLHFLGLGSWVKDWLGSPNIVSITIPLISMWAFVGLNMIIFSAGIVNIPSEIYEAAEIDGATGMMKVWRITIPLLKDTFRTYGILCVTGCLKVFDIVFVMTSGGPNGASDVPATLLYYSAFRYQKFGYANSIGATILILGLVISLVLNKFLKSEA